MKFSEIILGHRYEDMLTGFSGFAIARIEYLDGTASALLEAVNDHDALQSAWISSARLTVAQGVWKTLSGEKIAGSHSL